MAHRSPSDCFQWIIIWNQYVTDSLADVRPLLSPPGPGHGLDLLCPHQDTNSSSHRFQLADPKGFNWPVPSLSIGRSYPCGKTALAQQIGRRRGYRYYTFDDAATLAAARADITGFVARLERRAILDEVQHVPELFAALEPAIDANRNSLRFILTGSSNVLLIPRLSDSLAGRMEILRLYPLCQHAICFAAAPLSFMSSEPYSVSYWKRLFSVNWKGKQPRMQNAWPSIT